MSSRHQKERRLRPRSDPYRRNHFDQSRYLRLPLPQSAGAQQTDEPVASEENSESNGRTDPLDECELTS